MLNGITLPELEKFIQDNAPQYHQLKIDHAAKSRELAQVANAIRLYEEVVRQVGELRQLTPVS